MKMNVYVGTKFTHQENQGHTVERGPVHTIDYHLGTGHYLETGRGHYHVTGRGQIDCRLLETDLKTGHAMGHWSAPRQRTEVG
jgi:hypothetical protein